MGLNDLSFSSRPGDSKANSSLRTLALHAAASFWPILQGPPIRINHASLELEFPGEKDKEVRNDKVVLSKGYQCLEPRHLPQFRAKLSGF